MDPAAIETRLRDFLAARAEAEGIAAAWLFGRAMDCLAILQVEPTTPKKTDPVLEEKLEDLLGFPLRILILNYAASELVFRVLREGELLVQPDRARRARFEVDSRNEYWDFEPYLKLYREKNGLSLVPPLEELVERHVSSNGE